MSDVAVLGAHIAFVGSTHTEVEIFIWIMSPLWSERQVLLIQTNQHVLNYSFDFGRVKLKIGSYYHHDVKVCMTAFLSRMADC